MDARRLAVEFDRLRRESAARDARHTRVRAVRQGDWGVAFPGLFPEHYPAPMVANVIDTAARDLAEASAGVPTISCSANSVLDERKRTRGDRRTRIANFYVDASGLASQLLTGLDNFYTYSFLPWRVEPHMGDSRPHITLDSPVGAYYRKDRWGRTTVYARRWVYRASELAALFPEYAGRLLGDDRDGDRPLELVRWDDDEASSLFVPERGPLMLSVVRNPVGQCLTHVMERPGVSEGYGGQFDDVLWVQVARARLALLRLDAAHKSVEAPLAIPSDVQHLALGPDSVIRSSQPEKIRRVELPVPASVFAEEQSLEREARLGARYPEGRTGNIDASLITGRGIQALNGGFDQQIKTTHLLEEVALSRAIELCFRMDEALWGSESKEIRGSVASRPYTLTYRPERDIAGDYSVDVTFGLMAGLDPNRALVFGLQARGDKLISRTFLRSNLPVSLNVADEEKVIDVEDMRDALKTGVQQLMSAIPQMVTQGQDPQGLVAAAAKVVEARKRGVPIEEAVAEAFAPPEPEPQEEQPVPGPEGMPPEAGMVPGGPGQGGGQPPIVPRGPQQRPDLRQLLAGLTSGGSPNLQASVLRQQPVG